MDKRSNWIIEAVGGIIQVHEVTKKQHLGSILLTHCNAISYPAPMNHRQILHLDMNAFFASVEQAMNLELRGKAIAVIGRGRTVVTTSSYDARAFGVKTGMNTWQACQKCPHIIFVVGNNRLYTHTSSEIVKMMQEYTDLVEPFSIDEAFLDVTGSLKLHGSAENIAMFLKARIRQRFNITCSIGIAPNKLLAKLASDMKKPDGLVIIRPDDVASTLENIPIADLCGIGKKMERHLKLLGINTCGELGRFPGLIWSFPRGGTLFNSRNWYTFTFPLTSLPGYVNQSDEIYRAAAQIFDSVTHVLPVRLLGVRLSNLRHHEEQLPLFLEDRKKVFLAKAMDAVNDRFGEFAVTYGSVLDKEKKEGEQGKPEGSSVISPAWRPDGIRKVDVE